MNEYIQVMRKQMTMNLYVQASPFSMKK